MARSYITEKQVGHEFWYFSIKHAAQMLDQVLGRLGRKLTTPFELVYNQNSLTHPAPGLNSSLLVIFLLKRKLVKRPVPHNATPWMESPWAVMRKRTQLYFTIHSPRVTTHHLRSN
jgi:hypothetical protein